MSNFRLFWKGFWEAFRSVMIILAVLAVIALVIWGIVEIAFFLQPIIGGFFTGAILFITYILIVCIINGIVRVKRRGK